MKVQTYDEWRAELAAVAKRNRAARNEALAEGADTWLREGLRWSDDGVILPMTTRVPVVRDGHEDSMQQFTRNDGKMLVDAEAVVAMNHAWEAGEFPGLKRDIGRGSE